MEVLKLFSLIPKIFDLSTLFEFNYKSKIFYEFIGGISVSDNQIYSSFFKQKIGSKKVWNRYVNETVTQCESWFSLVSKHVAFNEMPILLIFEKKDNFTEDKCLEMNEIEKLMRFIKNSENFKLATTNRFRPTEEVFKFSDDNNLRNSLENKFKRNNLSNVSSNANSSANKPEESLTAERENSLRSKKLVASITIYKCIKCSASNPIENSTCINCFLNNEKIVAQIKEKNFQIQQYNANVKKAERKDREKSYSREKEPHQSNKETSKKKEESPFEPAEEVKMKRQLSKKNYDYPMQIKQKPEENDRNSIKNSVPLSICKKCLVMKTQCICRDEDETRMKPVPSSKDMKFRTIDKNDWICSNCKKSNKLSSIDCKCCFLIRLWSYES